MTLAVTVIWVVVCRVYTFVLFAVVVTSNENVTGYDVSSTAFPDRYFVNKEPVASSAFAPAKPTDVGTNYNVAEATTRRAFNTEPLPVSGRLPTPANDVGSVCSCDERKGVCDINCCCDRECSQEIALFTGCSMLTVSSNTELCSHAAASYGLQYTVEGYSELQSFVQKETRHHSLCIQSHYRVDGFYFPAPTLPLARNFDSLFKQFNRFAFSSPENNDMSTRTPAVLHKLYQYGDAIMSAQVNGKRGIFCLPTTSVSVQCVDQSPAAFLVDRRSRCSRRVVLKEDCGSLRALSLDTYTKVVLYAGKDEDATLVPMKMASVILQSLDGTQNEVRIDEEKNMRPYLINSNVCANVVVKVVYLVTYNMAGQIVNAAVRLLLGNFHVTPLTLEQEFSVQFFQEKNKNVPVHKSGNPGYVVGQPILSGQVISEERVLTINPGDTLSLLQSSANHNCMNGLHQRSPVLFGVESMSGCTLRLEDTEDCSLVSQIILDVLQGQTYPQYVATFANSALDSDLDWVPIEHNYNHRDSHVCNIPLALHLQIEWTKYGHLWNPQAQIVSIEQVILTGDTSLTRLTRGSDVSIQSSVSFKEIASAALPGYRATPTINAKLPVDFFFPFV
ncbi:tectonic-1 isoform X1 [Phycodurus eques]|uniref:tectonic-1 isoform X1 n=1 Tax=Phycodurus eques TaxID=693459 RepID=UPI002ACD7E9D|nr:tectonic-1 isoform X1 [Phycodurus eques]